MNDYAIISLLIILLCNGVSLFFSFSQSVMMVMMILIIILSYSTSTLAVMVVTLSLLAYHSSVLTEQYQESAMMALTLPE